MPDKKQIVTIDGLSRAATQYNNVLRELPFFALNEVTKDFKLNILKVQGEDKRINKRRQAGVLAPYTAGLTLGQRKELNKFYEAVLKPEETFSEENDNITNYKERKVMSNAGEWLDNQTKKHPLEALILRDLVTSNAEDIAFNLFFGERDEAILSAATAFNGFNSKISTLVAAGAISEVNNNLVKTAKFEKPVDGDDTEAYDQLVAFVLAGHPLLRRGAVELRASEDLIVKVKQAYHNKVKWHKHPTTEELMEAVRSDANCKGLELLENPIYGTGDQLILSKPGMFDVGVNNESDVNFVQVRNPYADPNEVQFWIQSSIDTRINDIHEKVFQTNGFYNESVDLAGDYKEAEVVAP